MINGRMQRCVHRLDDGASYLRFSRMIQIEQGWAFGEQINDKYRQHPNLRAYKHLDRKVRSLHSLPTNTRIRFGESQDTIKLEEPVREALKAVEKLQFHLEKTDTGATRIATKPLQRKKQKVPEWLHRKNRYCMSVTPLLLPG